MILKYQHIEFLFFFYLKISIYLILNITISITGIYVSVERIILKNVAVNGVTVPKSINSRRSLLDSDAILWRAARNTAKKMTIYKVNNQEKNEKKDILEQKLLAAVVVCT